MQCRKVLISGICAHLLPVMCAGSYLDCGVEGHAEVALSVPLKKAGQRLPDDGVLEGFGQHHDAPCTPLVRLEAVQGRFVC